VKTGKNSGTIALCFRQVLLHKVYAYIVKQNYVLGGIIFTIRKAQLHVSATNVGYLQVVQ